jgi:hypothetical protein
MTSDPERLLQGTSSVDDAELERELLRSIADVSPPAGAREQAWRGLSAQIAAVTVAAAGASAAAHASAAGASVAPKVAAGFLGTLTGKLVAGAALAVSTTAVATGAWVAFVREPEPARPPAIAVQKPLPSAGAPAAEAPREPAIPEETPAPKPREETPLRPEANTKAAPRALTGDALAEESALITEARADLKRGDARAALAALKRLKQKSPNGVLSQEREVLTIQALAKTGESTQAAKRARAFIERYPNSPHTPTLRSIAEPP